MVSIVPATTEEHLEHARALFTEYANSLEVDLNFQGFEQELDGLPGDYAPPDGCLFLAVVNEQTAGCVALHRWDDTTCEMKRLYVHPAYRRTGAGRKLAETVIQAARDIGYRKMYLDTLPTMQSAQKLYRSQGFRPIPPYRHNPVPGAEFLALDLFCDKTYKLSHK